MRAYEEKVKQLNARLPAPRPTISVVRVTATNLRYYQRANFLATILTDLGFPRPAGQNVDDFALNNQSLETIGVSGGDDDHRRHREVLQSVAPLLSGTLRA